MKANPHLVKQISGSITAGVAAAVIAILISTSAASAGPFHGGPGPGAMFSPLEKLIDHIDLSDQQEDEIEKIFEEMRSKKAHKTRFEMMKGFALLDPDDPSYDLQVEEMANTAAEKVKTKILEMNATRKAIYEILDQEQKDELSRVIKKKMSKMEKRVAKYFN